MPSVDGVTVCEAADAARLSVSMTYREGEVSVSVDREGVETRVIHDLVEFDGKRVLEVGCGDGRMTWRFASDAASVFAIDINEQKIGAAIDATPKGLRPKVRFQALDIAVSDPPGEPVDVAVLSYSL